MTVKDKLQLLDIQEVTTNRQEKNGTRIFRLPIKMYGEYIKVGSFKSGYVRRMNGGYTPYQLNKRDYYDHYYKSYDSKWVDGEYVQKWNGKYNKMTTRGCILIPYEGDRIEYLIDYCLKNYYIKQANQVEDGKFIPKWKHEYEMKNGDIERIRELQSENRRLHNIYLKQTQEIRELKEERDDKGALDNLSVIVNNERYRII